MSMTIDQARALVHTMIKSPKCLAHLESALGFGHLPKKVEDFDSNDPDTPDCCEQLVAYMEESAGALRAYLKGRPRQGDLGLEEAS